MSVFVRHRASGKLLGLASQGSIAVPRVPSFSSASTDVLVTRGGKRIRIGRRGAVGARTGGEREHSHGRQMQLAYVGFGLLWANAVWHLPFLLLGCAGVVAYGTLPLIRKADWKFCSRGRVSGELVMSVVAVGSLLLGQFFGALVANWFYHLREWSLAKTERRSRAEILGVTESLAHDAWVSEGEHERLVPVRELQPGQVVVLRPGDVIPVDGKVVDGFAMVDQQTLTGESRLKEVGVGDTVVAASALVTGRLQVEASRTGRDTMAMQVDALFARTQHYLTSHSDSRGERFSDALAIPAFVLAAGAFLSGTALRGLAVLNSWPVCGIVVVASTSMFSHLRLGARRGLLIKDARVLEQFRKVDTVIFDKTGTLTESDFRIHQMILRRGFEEDHVLALAAAAERPFRHPLARAIVDEARRRKLRIPGSSDGYMEIGFGVSTEINGVSVHIGSERFLRSERIRIPKELTAALAKSAETGNTGVLIAVDRKAAAAIEFASVVRSDAAATIAALRQMGVKQVGLLSGDHAAPTERTALDLGLDSWAAEQLPSQKADYITSLQREGKTVCYIGDGVNDAIALKRANVSISMNRAAGVAQESADVVLSELSLDKIRALAEISHGYEKNIVRSFTANCVPLGLSLVGTSFLGFGFVSSIVLSNLGLGLGMLSASAPLLNRRGEVRPDREDRVPASDQPKKE